MGIRKKCVILNTNSKGGKAPAHWQKVESSLERQIGPLSVYVSKTTEESVNAIKKLIIRGERIFISAGGDGCVNLLINTIIANKNQEKLSDFTIGAVGLGSSNDYHKPFSDKFDNLPIRLNDANPLLRDVGKIVFKTEKEDNAVYFLISASIGLVAEGNANFNKGGRILNILKKFYTDLAIFWTFFQTLRSFRNVPLKLNIDDDEMIELQVSYLAISKTPYISGMFRFNDTISRDDGMFLVKILHSCTKMDLIRCMFKLMKGNEEGIPNLLTRYARRVVVSACDPFTFEFDGETQETRMVRFEMYEERVKECT